MFGGIDKLIRVSLGFDELPAFRGHPRALVAPYRELDGGNLHAANLVPIHATTHRDFPRVEETGTRMPDEQPLEMDAVIIDLRYKQDIIRNKLVKPSDADGLLKFLDEERLPFLDHALLSDGLPGVQRAATLARMVQELGIRKEELQGQLLQAGISAPYSNHMIMLWTGWPNAYNQHRASYNNVFFEGLSAYLCHPYVDAACAEWLAENGATSVAHDLPSIENPLFYARGPNILPTVREARLLMDEFLAQTGRSIEVRYFEKYCNTLRAEQAHAPIHIKLLQLWALTELGPKLRLPHLTTVYVVPVPVLQDPVGISCEVFVRQGAIS